MIKELTSNVLTSLLIALMAFGSTLQASPRPNRQTPSPKQKARPDVFDESTFEDFNLELEERSTLFQEEYFGKKTAEERRKMTATILKEVGIGALPLAALFGGKQLIGITPLDPSLLMIGGLSIIAVQRYIWQTITAIRANLYLNVDFPKIRKAANKVAFKDLPQNLFVIPTYGEDGLVSRMVFEAIADQAKDFPKPFVLAVSAKDQIDIAHRNKNLEDDPEENEHDFLENTVRNKEARTISVEIHQDFPDSDNLLYVQSIQEIVDEEDEQVKAQLIADFEPIWGKRLREDMHLSQDSEFQLPRIIMLRLYQDNEEDLLLSSKHVYQVKAKGGLDSGLVFEQQDVDLMRSVLNIAEETDLGIKGELVERLEATWENRIRGEMGLSEETQIKLPKEMSFSFSQTLQSTLQQEKKLVSNAFKIDFEHPATEDLQYLKGLLKVAEAATIEEAAAAQAHFLPLWKEMMTRDMNRVDKADFDSRVTQMPESVIFRIYQDAIVQIPREEWEGDKKRRAMGTGFRTLAAIGFSDKAIVAAMDGDSLLTPGCAKKTSEVMECTGAHAATTKETVKFVDRLKTGWRGTVLYHFFKGHMMKRQTNLGAQSYDPNIGLGNILVLTGRYSVISWNIAKLPEFAQLVQTDKGRSAIWGLISYLSGDDKSTRFAIVKILQRLGKLLGKFFKPRIIYIPDVEVVSLENQIKEGAWAHAITNIQRWMGNMERNVTRTINLGPFSQGLYQFIAVIDQLLNPFTGTLIVNLAALSLIGAILGTEPISNFIGLMSWVYFSTGVQTSIVFRNWGEKFDVGYFLQQVGLQVPVKFITNPTKLGTLPALGVQKWVRHGQSRDSAGSAFELKMKRTVMHITRAILFTAVFLMATFIKGKFDVKDFTETIFNPSQATKNVLKQADAVLIEPPTNVTAIELQGLMQSAADANPGQKLVVHLSADLTTDQPLTIPDGMQVEIRSFSNLKQVRMVSSTDVPAIVALPGSKVTLKNVILQSSTAPVLVEADGATVYLDNSDIKGRLDIFNSSKVYYVNSLVEEHSVDETSKFENLLMF